MYYRILHLSDLHWREESKADQEIVTNALLKDLKEITADRQPDRIVFTGDLVYSGSEVLGFEAAKAYFLDKIRDLYGLSDKSILICPGNHDVDRKKVIDDDYLEIGLKNKLISRDSLNEHLDKFIETSGRDESVSRLQLFFNFYDKYFGADPVFSSKYVNCFHDGDIGFALFNTAWRSTGSGERERNHILLGERAVDLAAKKLSDCRIRIAIMHHPLEWLANWDQRAARVPIFEHFDLLLFGHVHDGWPVFTQTPVGECILAQAGCIYESRDYYNGYQIIDVGTKTREFIFRLRSFFNEPARRFGAAESIAKDGIREFAPQGDGRRAGTLTARDLAALQGAIDLAGDDHVAVIQRGQARKFDEIFEPPSLSYESEHDSARLSPAAYRKSMLKIEEVIPSSGVQVVGGARESGKTTLSYKIARICADMDSADFKIPIFVDFTKVKVYTSLDRFVRRCMTRLNVDISARTVLTGHRCLFIVDKVKLGDSSGLEALRQLLSESATSQHSWLILVDYDADLANFDERIHEIFCSDRRAIFIHSLSRSQVRSLVSRISPSGDFETNTIHEDIIKLIGDNQLPRTAYIVTILTFVFRSVRIDFILNEANLVDKMIDILLKKHDQSNILRHSGDFTGKNIILEELAYFINESGGYLSENSLTAKLAEFLCDRGISLRVSEIMEYFLFIGILERVEDEICFRYRTFESFFLARYALRHPEFTQTLMTQEGILKLRKEYSFLCDLSRQDGTLLTSLEQLIADVQPSAMTAANPEGFLAVIDSRLSSGPDNDVENSLVRPNASEVDELADTSDRFKRSFKARMEVEMEKTFGQEAEDNDLLLLRRDEKLPRKFVRQLAHITSWSLWGRAISSLDFVKLSVRKPSLKRLLTNWAKLVTIMITEASKVVDSSEPTQPTGDVISEEMKEKFKRHFILSLPGFFLQSTFSHIGVDAMSTLLINVFDESDLGTPESLGTACLLANQRPAGWDGRVERYINFLSGSKKNGCKYPRAKARILLEIISNEYFWRTISEETQSSLENLISKLLRVLGFGKREAQSSINKLEQDRAKNILVTADFRR
jgi:predicted MPP superfamily phosphohydrolase